MTEETDKKTNRFFSCRTLKKAEPFFPEDAYSFTNQAVEDGLTRIYFSRLYGDFLFYALLFLLLADKCGEPGRSGKKKESSITAVFNLTCPLAHWPQQLKPWWPQFNVHTFRNCLTNPKRAELHW